MSFVRLDSGNFPPLNGDSSHRKSNGKAQKKSNHPRQKMDSDDHSKQPIDSINFMQETHNPKGEKIDTSSDFVKCRAGLKLHEFQLDLELALKENYIGRRGDFIVAPIQTPKSWYDHNDYEPIPDLALPCELWCLRVAIDLGRPTIDYFDGISAKYFDRLFRHALYLSAPVIIISCPNTELAYTSLASIVNDRLRDSKINRPLILFRVPYRDGVEKSCTSNDNAISCDITYPGANGKSVAEIDHSSYVLQNPPKSLANHRNIRQSSETNGDSSGLIHRSKCPWVEWNNIRSYINPDNRIGVCLSIDRYFMQSNDDELDRWLGEPVRMIILNTDLFERSNERYKTIELNRRCQEFITKLCIKNSLKTSFVIEGKPNEDLAEPVQYIDYMCYNLRESHQDPLLPWNDKIQPPLQPLSSNLDSSTYGVFEMDSMKYIKYHDAMLLALEKLVSKNEFKDSATFVLMVCGAGRGPLVDCFINAVKLLDSKFFFKIYALDKNPSSVISLKYKLRNSWHDEAKRFEVEVVEADMRTWNPGCKADIIATELLGSLSDNELSPECIDGLWDIATPETISIPQDYASFIAPICSYKLYQELSRYKDVETHPYDQVYVVRLSNCYHISAPQQLFKFEHQNLSEIPSKRDNERYKRLVFWSKVDTVCHGFAGYFVSRLFANVTLSTVVDQKTPKMDSWFPAFIPLERPVDMPKGTKLELHFWRKESASSVWYQWVVTHPIRSRIHTQYGLESAMSKQFR